MVNEVPLIIKAKSHPEVRYKVTSEGREVTRGRRIMERHEEEAMIRAEVALLADGVRPDQIDWDRFLEGRR